MINIDAELSALSKHSADVVKSLYLERFEDECGDGVVEVDMATWHVEKIEFFARDMLVRIDKQIRLAESKRR